LRKTHGDNIRAAVIGPAGENLVVHAAIVWTGTRVSAWAASARAGLQEPQGIAVRAPGVSCGGPQGQLDILKLHGWKTIRLGETRCLTAKRSRRPRDALAPHFPREPPQGHRAPDPRTATITAGNELTFNYNSFPMSRITVPRNPDRSSPDIYSSLIDHVKPRLKP
jgi:hypothetical protein